MNSPHLVSTLAMVALLHVADSALKAQSQYENPWGMAKPEQTENLAFERYPVEGFAWPTSVLPGDTIRFYVSVMNLEPQTPSQQYEAKIFRSPDFGAGQEVYTFPNATGHFYPLRDANGDSIFPGQTNRLPVDYKIGCKDFWSPTARVFVIPSNWSSGIYYVRLNHLALHDPGEYYYVQFIVRAAQPGQATKILFKYELNTVQAYNYWGGGSLYSLAQDPSTLTSDSIIAFDRPVQRTWSQSATYFASSFEKTLRDSGYSMEYCNNIDLDKTGPGFGIDLLSNYNMLVLWGHDEYWSRRERDNIESFKGNLNSGLHGNIARFAPNTCYWRITWIGNGDEHLKLMCLKDNYPSGFHPPYDLWRDSTYGPRRPEAKFLGSQYQWGWNDIRGDSLTEQPPDRVYMPSHWIFRNANLTTVGQEFGFGVVQNGRRKGIVSGELDNTITNRADFPLDTLAQRNVYSHVDPGQDSVLHQMIYYEDTLTNARVFAQGAGGWILGLVSEPGSIDTDVVRMKTITINIISHFSGKKYLGNVYTLGPENALRWQSPIELDGDTRILPGKYLKVIATTVTIDSAFYVDGTLEINGNVTLTGSGNITVGSTGRIILTNGSSLTLDAGVTTVLERDSAIHFGSGSSLEVKGLLRTTYGNYTVVPYGCTLRIHPGAVLQWGSYGRLVVEGTLSAIGIANNPIIITKAPGELAPGGIELAVGSVDTVEYCHFTDLYTGVSIAFCNAVLRNNQFTNCAIAISSDAYKQPPIIEENTIDGCWIGLDVFTSSVIGIPSIQRNTITACTYGIILNSSYKSILTENHVQNGHVGVLVSNSSPVLYRNVIQDNVSLGVFVIENGNPRFGDYQRNDPGNNVIRNNAAVQVYAVNAVPFFGLQDLHDYGGYNSIYGPEEVEVPNVVAEEGAEVTAHIAWWGVYPPKESRFIADKKSIIDFSNALDYDPNDGLRPTGMLAFNGKSDPLQPPQMSITPEQRQLRRALVLRSERSYAEAIGVYANLISSRPNAPESRIALVELRNTYQDYLRWSGDSTLQTTLENYLSIQLTNHPNALVKRVARFLRAGEISNRRDYSRAIMEYQQLLESSASEEERLTCVFALFNINANGLHDRTAAQSWLAQLQNQYSNDVRTQIAAIRFAGMSERTSGSGLQRMSLAETGDMNQELPIRFSLSQNYPNPFNPSTHIPYSVRGSGFVSLKVYDVLGREVATLVNEVKPPGEYSVVFDGTNLPSGVYFYRLTAGGFTETRRMIVIR
jgi:hypothetical protein